jgi:hypothetical protein
MANWRVRYRNPSILRRAFQRYSNGRAEFYRFGWHLLQWSDDWGIHWLKYWRR